MEGQSQSHSCVVEERAALVAAVLRHLGRGAALRSRFAMASSSEEKLKSLRSIFARGKATARRSSSCIKRQSTVGHTAMARSST